MTQLSSEPRSRKTRDPVVTRNLILEAAQKVISQRGPEAFTMSEVARQAGVNRVTLYQHFRTREHLAGAAIARVSDRLSLMLENEAPPGELIGHMLDFLAEHPEMARLWVYGILSDVPLPDQIGWERYMRTMRDFASSGSATEGIDAEMLGRILHAAVLLWSVESEAGFDEGGSRRQATHRFARELIRLLRDGAWRSESSERQLTSDSADGS